MFDQNWNFIKEYISSHESMKNGFYYTGIKRSVAGKRL